MSSMTAGVKIRLWPRIRNRPDRQSVRLTTVTWNNAIQIITLKLDQTYWPAYEILYTDDGWQRQAVN